jgi:hypothetical protein
MLNFITFALIEEHLVSKKTYAVLGILTIAFAQLELTKFTCNDLEVNNRKNK